MDHTPVATMVMNLSDGGIVSDLPGDDTNHELLRVLNGTLVRQSTGEKGSQDGKIDKISGMEGRHVGE